MLRPAARGHISPERGAENQVLFRSSHCDVEQTVGFIFLALIVFLLDHAVGGVVLGLIGTRQRPARTHSVFGVVQRIRLPSSPLPLQRGQDDHGKLKPLRGVHRHYLDGVEVLLGEIGFGFIKRRLLQFVKPRDQLVETEPAPF